MKRTYEGPDLDGTVQYLSEAPYWQNDGETVDVTPEETGEERAENVPIPGKPNIENIDGQTTFDDWGWSTCR